MTTENEATRSTIEKTHASALERLHAARKAVSACNEALKAARAERDAAERIVNALGGAVKALEGPKKRGPRKPKGPPFPVDPAKLLAGHIEAHERLNNGTLVDHPSEPAT